MGEPVCDNVEVEARYEPQALEPLVKSLEEQVTNGTYDLDNNLSVLTLYNLYPSHTDVDVCYKIMVKAMMQLPHRDFTECLYLLPEHLQQESLLQNLISIENAIESCKFKHVWLELNTPASDSANLLKFRGFEQWCRDFIVETIGLTYQVIPLADLLALLNLTEDSEGFKELLAKHEWVIEQSSLDSKVRVVRIKWVGETEEGDGQGGANAKMPTSHLRHDILNKHMSQDNMRQSFQALCKQI